MKNDKKEVKKIIQDKSTFLTDIRIKEVKDKINQYFPIEVRQKLIDFKLKHPNYQLTNETHQNKVNWGSYMVEKLLNSKNRYTSMIKVLEDPNEKRNIIREYIGEYFYDDNDFIYSLSFDILDWYLSYLNGSLECLDKPIKTLEVVCILDLDEYFENNFSIRSVNPELLKQSEKVKILVDDIYKNPVNSETLKNSIELYLRDNDYQRFHNRIVEKKVVKSWFNPDVKW